MSIVAIIYRNRGVLSSLPLVVMNIGYSVSILLASLIPLNYFFVLVAVPVFGFLVLSFHLPDSPVWLMQRRRPEAAEAVLTRLRGRAYAAVKGELNEIREVVENSSDSNSGGHKALLSRSFLLPLSILSAMFFFHASVGGDILSSYAMVIFTFPGIPVSPAHMTFIFQLGWTLAFLIGSGLTTRLGRRTQFIGGGLAMAVPLTAIGCLHFFGLLSPDRPLVSWAAVALHVVFVLAFGIGFGPVPHTLTGELFPAQLKSLGCGIAIGVRFLTQFFQLR